MLRLTLSVCLFLSSLLHQVAANPGPDSSRCYTSYGSTETAVKTTWKTHYTRCTTTKTSTIVTTTKATVPTITSTTTSYVTVSNGTSTVPASSGFVPIRSSLPGSNYDGADGPVPFKRKRSNHGEAAPAKRASGPAAFGLNGLKPRVVDCHSWTHGQCITATKTITSTSTIAASVSAYTVNKTVTSTTMVPATTYYAACAINNIADLIDGTAISNVHQAQGTSDLYFTSANTAYECCVATILLPYGQTYGFLHNSGGGCFARSSSDSSTCTNGQTSNLYNPEVQGSYNFTVGNLVCGEVVLPAVTS